MEEGAKDKRGRRKRPPTNARAGTGVRFFDDSANVSKFFEAVEVFGNFSDACELVGIDRQVVYNERDRNPAFASMLKRAKVAKRFRLAKQIEEIGTQGAKKTKGRKAPEYRALAWLLEREFSQQFGRKDPQAVTPEMILDVTNKLQALILAFVPEDRRAEATAAFASILTEFSTPFKPADPDEENEERREDG